MAIVITLKAAPDSPTQRRECLVAATLAALTVLAHRFSTTDMNRATWEQGVRETLVHAHLTAAALAKGGWAAIDRDTATLVGERLGTQFAYLERFAATVPGGDALTAGQLARLAQYGNAAVRGTFSAVLRQAAFDRGDTQERNIEGSSEPCGECPELSALGWVEIGTLPEIGDRQCAGNCRCEIEVR